MIDKTGHTGTVKYKRRGDGEDAIPLYQFRLFISIDFNNPETIPQRGFDRL